MIAALVLAAGLSRRMGRAKLLLDIEARPIVRWAVEGLVPHVDDTVVVTGPDSHAIHTALEGLPVRFCTNPRPEEGQGRSIAAGIAALLPGTRAVLVALGDQPALAPDVVPAVLAAFRRTGQPIVAPVYRGVQGTPVLFSAPVFDELRALTGDAGARRVLLRTPERVAFVDVDAEMPADVDTPDDYDAVRHRHPGR